MSIKSLQRRRTPGSRDDAEQRQTAADPWTKSTDLSHCRNRPNSTSYSSVAKIRNVKNIFKFIISFKFQLRLQKIAEQYRRSLAFGGGTPAGSASSIAGKHNK